MENNKSKYYKKNYNNNYYKYSNNHSYKKNNYKYNKKKKNNKADNYLIDEEIKNNEYEIVLKKKESPIVTEIELEDEMDNIEKDKEEQEIINKKNKSLIQKTALGYILGVLILILALVGTTYAYFNYTKVDTREATMTAAEMYVKINENNLTLNLNKLYPRTTLEARSRTDNYVDFTLVGKNTAKEKVLAYNFTLSEGTIPNGKTRINSNNVLFDLAELDSNNNETLLLSGVTLSSFNSATISNFYIPTEQTIELQRKFRVRAWINESVTISDDTNANATYTQSEFLNLAANFTLHVNSQDSTFNPGN